MNAINNGIGWRTDMPDYVAHTQKTVAYQYGIPETLTAFYTLYGDRMTRFAAVLSPYSGIVRRTMQIEGLEYAQAIDYLVNEHFALQYADYVEKFDPSRSADFLTYCLGRFVGLVRQAAYRPIQQAKRIEARTGSRKSMANVCTIVVSDTPIDDHAAAENCSALSTPGDQLRIQIMLEEHAKELERVAGVMSSLRQLDSQVSYCVWRHAALEETYDTIGKALGVTALRAKALYVSGIAELRRLNQD